jgi:hypothetical protein
MVANTNQSVDHRTATARSGWISAGSFVFAVMQSAGGMALVLLATDIFGWGLFNESPSQRLSFVMLWAVVMATWHRVLKPRFFGAA